MCVSRVDTLCWCDLPVLPCLLWNCVLSTIEWLESFRTAVACSIDSNVGRTAQKPAGSVCSFCSSDFLAVMLLGKLLFKYLFAHTAKHHSCPQFLADTAKHHSCHQFLATNCMHTERESHSKSFSHVESWSSRQREGGLSFFSNGGTAYFIMLLLSPTTACLEY